MMLRISVAMLALLGTGGCNGQPGAGEGGGVATAGEGPLSRPVSEAGKGRCNSGAAGFAMGRRVTPPLGEEAKIRAGAARLRIIRPGDLVTEDHVEERLNLVLAADDRIVGIRCG